MLSVAVVYECHLESVSAGSGDVAAHGRGDVQKQARAACDSRRKNDVTYRTKFDRRARRNNRIRAVIRRANRMLDPESGPPCAHAHARAARNHEEFLPCIRGNGRAAAAWGKGAAIIGSDAFRRSPPIPINSLSQTRCIGRINFCKARVNHGDGVGRCRKNVSAFTLVLLRKTYT